MQNISRFLLALPLLLCPLPFGAQELPLDIEIDLAVTALESAVVAEDHAGVLDHIERLRTLDPALGDGELLYFEAVAAREMGDLDRMETALTRFLTEVGRQSDSYTDALAMMQELRTARAGQVAAAEGMAQAMAALETENYAEALRLLQPLAEAGEAQAQYEIGELYRAGNGVERDFEEGVRWHSLAAEQGYGPAQYELGWAYSSGIGVERDNAEGVRLYRLAAEQNVTEAQTRLGELYLSGANSLWLGSGVAQDFDRAMEWFRRAVEAGDVSGYGFIGNMYRDGLAVSRDFGEALRLYRLAGWRSNIAALYERGFGAPQDFTEAARLYRAALDDGMHWHDSDLKRLDEHKMISGDWHVAEGGSCAVYTFPSDSTAYPYLILSQMKFSVSSTYTTAPLRIDMVSPNPFDEDRPVTANVDGQHFDLQVYFFSPYDLHSQGRVMPGSTDGDPPSRDLVRAIRAGQSVTVSGTSPAGQAISVTYSAAGFTRAFNEMARLCNRPDILRWIQ